tara:strand:+ start:271 stop:504 length:234 start_codon:yes stop_codon:yes gene_type:complete
MRMTTELNQPAANEPMTPEVRLSLMIERHRAIDHELIDLQTHPWGDRLLIQRMKKEKLRLRDGIERLKDELIPDLDA